MEYHSFRWVVRAQYQILNYEEPTQHDSCEQDPKQFLLILWTALLLSIQFLVSIRVIGVLLKLVGFVLAFDVFFRPHFFEEICTKLWVNRQKPPLHIITKRLSTIIKEVLLCAELLLQVVNVALIVFKRFNLLLTHFIGEKSEKETLDERYDAHDERVGVLRFIHVQFGFLTS